MGEVCLQQMLHDLLGKLEQFLGKIGFLGEAMAGN
jgi:hypothetical protein